MAKLRIGVLHDYWWGEEEERAADQRPKRKAPLPDVVEVYEALKESGHTPVYLRLDGSAASLSEVAQSETDLIFNLVESFGHDILGGQIRHCGAGLCRTAAEMRHEQHVLEPEQIRMDDRLLLVHIERGPRDQSLLQRPGQRLLVDHGTARRIDQVRRALHMGQRAPVDQMPGLGRERNME